MTQGTPELLGLCVDVPIFMFLFYFIFNQCMQVDLIKLENIRVTIICSLNI